MSEAPHVCEPIRWATTVGETWTCDRCGLAHRSAYVEDLNLTPGALARVPAKTIGWTSAPEVAP